MRVASGGEFRHRTHYRPSSMDPTASGARLSMTMFRHRCHRLIATCVSVLSLLFSQLALASYVCPGQADAATMAAMMAAGEPCPGMDGSQPALCHEHGAAGAQAVDAVKVPAASVPLIVQVLAIPLLPDPVEACALPVAERAKPHPPWVPVFLSTLRLRV
jgi:hypothetical protein